ncbi:MAG TPA: hypothetical protein VH207_10790 [Chthoniobacterales bacterium]|nr:hypothetical protein [Chthoniobacterales bacterium]
MPNDEDTLAHPEQPRFLLSAWMWAVVLFVFFGVIVAITFSAMPRGSSYEEDRARARAEKLKTAEEEWGKTMSSYGWVDKAKGVAHIPIDRAMQLELADLQAKKPAPAGPIATPPPAEVPVTATGAPQPSNPPVAVPPGTSPTPPPISQEGPNSEIRGQPAAAANPPNALPGTQPGASATPAAAPNSRTEVPPVSPTVTPVQHPVGTPIPVRPKPPTSPAASATPPTKR